MLVTLIVVASIFLLIVVKLWPFSKIVSADESYLGLVDYLVRQIFTFMTTYLGFFSGLGVLLTALSVGFIFGGPSIIMHLLGSGLSVHVTLDLILLSLFLSANGQPVSADMDHAIQVIFDYLLAPLFWYALLGMTGAVAYTTVVMMRDRLPNLVDTNILEKTYRIFAFLPFRAVLCCMALVGHFDETVKVAFMQGFDRDYDTSELLRQALAVQELSTPQEEVSYFRHLYICWFSAICVFCFVLL